MTAAMDNTRPAPPALSFFERYLTLWVALTIVAGIVLGQVFPSFFQAVGALEVARVNLPVGVLIWVMIIPMLVRIDLRAIRDVTRHARGIGITLFVVARERLAGSRAQAAAADSAGTHQFNACSTAGRVAR